jgi:hypothetical protein
MVEKPYEIRLLEENLAERFYLLLLFFLTANGFLPGGSHYTITHNKQITHIT